MVRNHLTIESKNTSPILHEEMEPVLSKLTRNPRETQLPEDISVINKLLRKLSIDVDSPINKTITTESVLQDIYELKRLNPAHEVDNWLLFLLWFAASSQLS